MQLMNGLKKKLEKYIGVAQDKYDRRWGVYPPLIHLLFHALSDYFGI